MEERSSGYDASSAEVTRVQIALDDYYEASHDLIDRAAYRREHEIVRIVGELFGSSGSLLQRFENVYSETDGAFVRGRAEHDDGMVVET